MYSFGHVISKLWEKLGAQRKGCYDIGGDDIGGDDIGGFLATLEVP
jgi:hypothetical protein